MNELNAEHTRQNARLVLVGVLIIGAVIAINLAPAILHSGLPGGDISLIALHTRDFMDGERLTGPYSRFGFAHPGPFFFGWYASLGLFVGLSMSQLMFSQLLLNVLCIVLSVALLRSAKTAVVNERSSLAAYGMLASLCLALLTSQFIFQPLTEVWGPVAILFPLLLCVTALIAALQNVQIGWMVAACAATACVQNHLGSLPAIAILIGISLLIGLRRYGRSTVQALVLACVAAFCLWLPPIIEALSVPHLGNLGRIIDFFRRKEGAASAGEAIAHIAATFGPLPVGLLLIASPCIALLFTPARSATCDAAILAAAGMVGVLLGGLGTVGEFHPYLFYTLLVFASVAIAAGLAAVLERACMWLHRPPIQNSRALLALNFLFAASLLSQTAYAPWGMEDQQRAARVVDLIQARISSNASKPLCILQQGNPIFSVVAAVAFELSQRGIPFVADSKRAYLYGRYRKDPRCSERAEFSGTTVLFAPTTGDAANEAAVSAPSASFAELFRDESTRIFVRNGRR